MMGYGVDSGRKPDFEHAREDCMETLGMGIDDTSCNVLEKMMNKKLLQSQSQSQSPEESVMGETDFEVVRENSVAVSNSIKQGDKNSSISSRDGHVCRFCGRVFSSGRALGGHVRVHGTSRSNGDSSSSGIVISRGGRSSADNWMKKSKVPTSRSNGNSNWVRNGSIEEEGEEEEEDYGVLKSMNMDAEEEELSDLKMVSLYTLRRNPKRSRRLNDEEFSMDLSTKNSRACVECGKEFFSSKALFGHMRCHPEREWRGIQPPDDTDDDDKEDNINGHGIVFADPGAVSVSPLCWQSSEDLEEKEKEEEEEEAVSVSDEESDRESMKKSRKEAYEPFSRSLLTWSVTAKRSRRRPVGLIQTQLEEDAGKEDVDNNNPEELEGDNEAARFLVMLASIADKANTNSSKVNRPVERQLTEESVYHSRKRKYEYQESMTETRGKYKCNTCKKLFNSHQALGGHRASHRKVKGCFAITYVNEEVEEVTEEEITEDGSSQLMVEYDMCSSHEREEDKRATNMSNLGHEKKMELAIPMKKAKGHECSICHKVFPSGQALGGHKRCHWSGERVPEPANSVISTEEQPKQRDTKKEPLFDLNEPAPVDEEDFEDAYGMMEVVPAFAKRIKMLEAVSNDGFRYVECNICGYKFTSMDELRTHQIAHALMPAS